MTRITSFWILALISTSLIAQDFYDINTIQTLEITFAESNWDQLLDAEKAGDENYVMAQSIEINGEVFDSVGVKYKGNSTYNANQVKNPFHIELDTYKDQEYDGYTDIKLSNVANDPSFLREVLSYQILQKYMDAPLSNYANVYVNGALIGLYSNSESVSKKFVKSRFGSKKNTFIKCNPPNGADHNTTDVPNLIYLGQDSSDYYNAYEMKSDQGWKELVNLCDTLANYSSSIEEILDVDRALWMLAFNNVLVNLDSYSGMFSQNYYLYRDDSGRFIPIMWDFNESFGRFSQSGSTNLNGTADKQKMSHLLHENDADFPLIQKLLNVPMYKRMYIAHMKTIVLENFDNNEYFTAGETLQDIIDAAVQADGNKFFSYSNFISNLTNDISVGPPGPGGSSTPGISNLMDGRSSYLLGLSDFTQTEPTISDIELSNPTPIMNETISLSATVTDGSILYLGYRSDTEAAFIKIQMADDGMHNDGSADDGIYGAEIEINNTLIQYYLYAENENVGVFSPNRAEHEYHSITATITEPTVGNLVINEFMASNEATVADQDNEYDDWIELYNNGSEAIDLEGYFLSDDADDLMLWVFPSGSSIDAGGYLIVWADKDEEQTGLHANFKLSANAESIFLVNSEEAIVDEVSYADQTTDISYGRFANGTGNFQIMTPTFSAENSMSMNVESNNIEEIDIMAYPNPSSGSFSLVINHNNFRSFEVFIYDVIGNLVLQDNFSQNTTINTSGWHKGIYIIRVDNSYLKISVIE